MATTDSSDSFQTESQSGATPSGTACCSSSSQTPVIEMPLAPPRTPPDQSSIQSSLDKNKETLKRKLMLRRSVNELVDRGIYPPLKTPPAFAEKTKQLERAKTGDLLRHRIQQRPDRQLLVQQHILEDTTIDPSLHERQRLLKRSRLLDGLNGKLAHRPGPLELVQGNILQPSHELANAIKDGTIQFVPTCDSEDMDQSSSSFMFDDESTGSDGAPSPSMDESSGLSDVSSPSSAPPVHFPESFPISFTFTKNIPVPLSANKSPQLTFMSPTSAVISTSSSTAKFTSKHPGISLTTSSLSTSINNHNHINSCAGKSRSKKPKPKTLSKAKIIKFHEYKGPPSVVKSQSSTSPVIQSISNSTEDTPYHILLQQQQLFLQWQLEFQQKQQHGSTSLPDNTSVSPTLSPILAASPVVPASAIAQVQPVVVGNTNLVQAVSSQPSSLTSTTSIITQSPVVVSTNQAVIPLTSPAPPPPPPPPPPPLPPSKAVQPLPSRQLTKALTSIPASALCLPKLTGNLEEMKVADLKAELKKRSLPVSGPKPQLIERLKPFTETSCGSPVPSTIISKSNSTSRPPSRVSTPLQFSQTTFHIKTEPNGELSASPVTRPIPSTSSTTLPTSSSCIGTSNNRSTFSLPITLPFSMPGIRTVVSVKPMIKEEPVATTDISPPTSPPVLQASTPVSTTPMSPDFDHNPPSLTPKLTIPSPSHCQNLIKSANGLLLLNGTNNISNSLSHGQTVVSMNSDSSQPVSVVPAEMMPMEVDSVSIDLNQGVDDTAFKAASLGQSLDPTNFKSLIQQPISNACFKNNNLTQSTTDNNFQTVTMDTNLMDSNSVKTINLSPNFDSSTAIKTINIHPTTDLATIRTINLGSGADPTTLKTLSLSPGADSTVFKTISLSPVKDTTSLLKTVKIPLSQLSPTLMSPVQLAAPVSNTLSTPAALLQLQQLQTLQQLQQQLMQYTQVNQFQQQTLGSAHNGSVQLASNDHVVLAQAKQIEELQRQLQESHLKLKLQQLQQQQQHHQQQQQQQQQQLWKVQIPTNFAQNSLLTKLSQEQLTISPQNGHRVMSVPIQRQQSQPAQVMLQPTASVVQQQQSQPAQVMLHPTASVVQQAQPAQVLLQPTASVVQQPASIFFNTQASQQTPQVISGVQLAQQHQTTNVTSSQNVINESSNVIGSSSVSNSNPNENSQMAGVTSSQSSVSLPYAIHINLTSPGQVKLPQQLQPIATSTSIAATTTKSSLLPPFQLPAQLLLTPTTTSILPAQQQVCSESSSPKSTGTPPVTSVPKSQTTSGQSFVLAAATSSGLLIPGHTNGVIARTSSSITPSSAVTDHPSVQHCSSNGFFNGPLKEPPRYDEAIKIKQQQVNSPASTNGNNNKNLVSNKTCLSRPLSLGTTDPRIKSQTMDDVLEILIRNGELPPSAATEALPATKMTLVMDSPPTSLAMTKPTPSSLPVTFSASTVAVTAQSVSVLSPHALPALTSNIADICNNNIQHNNNHHHHQYSPSSCSRDHTLTSVHTSMFSDTYLNDIHSSSPQSHFTSGSSSLNDGTCQSEDGELLDWGEMLHSPDLCSMDWSTESGFGHLDLEDSNLNFDSKIGGNNIYQNESLSSHDVKFGGILGQDSIGTINGLGSEGHSGCGDSTGLRTPSVHGSEPDLTVIGSGRNSSETNDPTNQMDMSEWLDVIVPNTSVNLEHMSTPASIAFSADSILTPRTQMDVFDIFNFDEPDFGSPSLSWNRLTEKSTHS